MVSVELLETEKIIQKYAPQFENNTSKIIREALIYYDYSHQQKQQKQNRVDIFQTIGIILTGICFILLSMSILLEIQSFITPSILFISGIFFFFYVYFLIKEKTIWR